jgi:hypothetical protein
MKEKELEKLKYPIGKFVSPKNYSESVVKDWISILEYFPERMESLVNVLSDSQLDTRYRPEGWTIRQVVHHLADSHHHSYIRFKWALTEDRPVIKYYFEKLWAELHDAKTAPIEHSLAHLKAVHNKLVYLLKSLDKTELHRSFIHPEYNEEVVLWKNIGIYAWHCDHHYSHIENVMKLNDWDNH